jgi:hypothetical protein
VLHLPARRPAVTWGWAMAAGFALLLVSAVALVLSTRSGSHGANPTLASRDSATSPAGGTTELATFDAAQVEGEIADLQAALEKGRGKLDPKTVEVLEKNLTLIRKATEDAKRALAADPANKDLQHYFASTVHSKLDLMRRATSRRRRRRRFRRRRPCPRSRPPRRRPLLHRRASRRRHPRRWCTSAASGASTRAARPTGP